jgi:hypothetical protein
MKREIGVERLYSLGDFKNVKFFDSIIEVPEEFVFDQKLVGEIKFLQIISVELTFRRYMKLMEENPMAWGTKAIDSLEKMRQDTIDVIKESLKNGKTEA